MELPVDVLLELPDLAKLPKPIDLCEQGKFTELFLLYDDLFVKRELRICGYQPSDYLLKKKDKLQGFVKKGKSENVIPGQHLFDERSHKYEGYQPIHYAAAHGDIIAVRKLVEKYKCSPNSLCEENITPLDIATHYGHFDVIKYFIQDCRCNPKDDMFAFNIVITMIETKCEERCLQSVPMMFNKPSVKLEGKWGNPKNYIRFVNFFHKFFKYKYDVFSTMAIELIFLFGEYEDLIDLKSYDTSGVALKEMISKSRARCVFSPIEIAFFGDNCAMIKQLLANDILVPDGIVISSALDCHASYSMLSLLVGACTFNPVFDHLGEKLRTFFNNNLQTHFQDGSLTSLTSLLELLDKKFGDFEDANKQNLLHHACKSYSNFLLMDQFLQGKPHLQTMQDANQQLPLHIACSLSAAQYPNQEIITFVSSHCNIDTCDKDGNTPLHVACMSADYWGALTCLLQNRSSSLSTKSNKVEQELIPQQQDDMKQVDQCGNTVLHQVYEFIKLPLIKHLVQKLNASINTPNSYGALPLHLFLRYLPWLEKYHLEASNHWQHYFEEMEMILSIFCNSHTINAQDNGGKTALHIACTPFVMNTTLQNLRVGKYMHKAKEKLLVPAFFDRFSPVIVNRINVCLPLVKLLLHKGADVNIPDANGNTPLHLACMLLHEEVIAYLVQSEGALTTVQNNKGQLPLHLILSTQCKNLTLIKLLVKKTSHYVKDNEGNTPLHIACANTNYCDLNINSRILLLITGDINCLAFSDPSKYHFHLTMREDAFDLLSIQNEHFDTPLQILLNRASTNVINCIISMFSLHHQIYNKAVCTELCLNYWLSRCKSSTYCEHFKVLQSLVNPVNTKVRDGFERTLLHVICSLPTDYPIGDILKVIPMSGDVIRAQDISGLTPLHVACKMAHVNAITYLLVQGNCDHGIKDDQDNLPLHYACETFLHVVLILPISNRDLHSFNKKGLGPIDVAVKSNKVEVVNYLHQKHNENCETDLALCSVGKHLIEHVFTSSRASFGFFNSYYDKMVEYLAVQRLRCTYAPDEVKQFVVQLACKVSFIETEKYLKENRRFLVYNCSLRCPPYCDINRVSLLHAAAWEGRTDILLYLISEEKCDPCSVLKEPLLQYQPEYQPNALVYACKLCEYNFYFHPSPFITYVPLWLQAEENRMLHTDAPVLSDTIQLLIESGCSIFHECYYYQNTVIENAFELEDFNLLTALISSESVNRQDLKGNSPLMILLKSKKKDSKYICNATKYLIEDCACDQNLTNTDGHNALHLACHYDNFVDAVNIMDLSNVHVRSNRFGHTPFEIACENESMAIVKYLMTNSAPSDEQMISALNTCMHKKKYLTIKLLLENLSLTRIMDHEQDFLLYYSLVKYLVRHSYRLRQNSEYLSCDVNIDSAGNTLLHIACKFNLAKIVKWVIKNRKINLLKSNDCGDTPLHVACDYSSINCVEILTNFGSDIKKIFGSDIKNNSGNTPLHLVCLNSGVACIKALHQQRLDVRNNLGDTPLHIACQQGCFSLVHYLLECFSGVQDALLAVNQAGDFPLHIALRTFGHTPTTFIRLNSLSKLVRLTCTNTSVVNNHPNLMHLACQSKNPHYVRIAKHLKGCDIRIDIVDDVGKFPIHYASKVSLDMVKACASHSIINSQDIEGNTPLHIACACGKYDICKYLVVQMNCDVEIQNKEGDTPLHNACHVDSANVNILSLLLQKTKQFFFNKNGDFPLHLLCKKFSQKNLNPLNIFIKFLNDIEQCKTIPQPNKNGELPLHYLCESKVLEALEAITALLPFIENLNLQAGSGNTPLHLACMNERHDIIQLLISVISILSTTRLKVPFI